MSWTSSKPNLYGRAQKVLRASRDVKDMLSDVNFEEHAFYFPTIGAAAVVLRTSGGDERIDPYVANDDMRAKTKSFIEKLLGEKLDDE